MNPSPSVYSKQFLDSFAPFGIFYLLEKYADSDITAIDDLGDLQVSPFTEYGTPFEIVEDIFGDREAYMQMVREIERQLYSAN